MPQKSGLEILPIREQRAFLTLAAALVMLVGGVAYARELIATDALVYYPILLVAVVGGLWYFEKCRWGAVPPHTASCWEIGYLEGHWAIRSLDTRQGFWVSPWRSLLQINPRSGLHLGEPEIIYAKGPDREPVERAQDITEAHVVGLLEAAQYDLHGRNRGLLGPTGALGLVRYTIDDEGRVHVATRQLIGFQDRITDHGELFQILERANR